MFGLISVLIKITPNMIYTVTDTQPTYLTLDFEADDNCYKEKSKSFDMRHYLKGKESCSDLI